MSITKEDDKKISVAKKLGLMTFLAGEQIKKSKKYEQTTNQTIEDIELEQ